MIEYKIPCRLTVGFYAANGYVRVGAKDGKVKAFTLPYGNTYCDTDWGTAMFTVWIRWKTQSYMKHHYRIDGLTGANVEVHQEWTVFYVSEEDDSVLFCRKFDNLPDAIAFIPRKYPLTT